MKFMTTYSICTVTVITIGLLLVNVQSVSLAIIINSTVPVVDYGYHNSTFYIGPQLNPVTISQQAIRDYEEYQSSPGNKTTLENLVIKADWLKTNGIQKENYTLLLYAFPFPPYNLTPPWYSAMAQGLATQALVGAFRATNNTSYLDAAEKHLNALFVKVEDGGVTYFDKYNDNSDGYWYEEYASPHNTREPRVLNGMIFTLIGVYEYYNLTHSNMAKQLFDKGVTALKHDLAKYDYLPLSNYDALGKPADEFYHRVHLELLEKIYNITKDPYFKYYYDQWDTRYSNYKVQ